MEFNRDASGTLTRLPKPCVDTGAGLERLAATLLNLKDPAKNSNYDTDLFVPLMKRAAELCGVDFQKEEALEEGKGGAASLPVIPDHARATTVLITDDVLPSNEGRGYVLRKVMRRAIRHGFLLGARRPFLHEMVAHVRELMHPAYPELLAHGAERTPMIVLAEERRFSNTVGVGLKKLEEMVHDPKQVKVTDSRVVFPGDRAFALYDTYGLPRDFIQDAVRDAGLTLDEIGFDQAMEEQRKRARASWKGGAKEAANPAYAKIAERFTTEPDFYFATSAKDACIEAIVTKNGSVKELKAGESGEVVLELTAIYS